MSMGFWLLLGWSGVAAFWWLMAIALVHASRKLGKPASQKESTALPALVIFKPLPPNQTNEITRSLSTAIESFVSQMDDSCEMLIGIPMELSDRWLPILDRWRTDFPGIRIRAVVRDTPVQYANPKIAWMEFLSPEASGTVWLWSDADITASPGMLSHIRGLLEASPQIGAVTVPYRVGSTARAAGWLDALFVNMEFLPGALLLRKTGPVPLAFGAAVLFRSEDFSRRISWPELGASLADDHELGKQLAPVLIAETVADTCALEVKLGPALKHVYRWQKTIRWCRPGGFAALLVILPLSGWLFFVFRNPTTPSVWMGLVGQYLFEISVAVALLNRAGFHGPKSGGFLTLIWPVLRVVMWLAAWLPLPVIWQNPSDSWSHAKRENSASLQNPSKTSPGAKRFRGPPR